MDVKNDRLSIQKVNQMPKDVFVGTVGWVFEHSPWVAEKVWENKPFPSCARLLQAMIDVVEKAEKSLQLALLRAHPDLGTRLKMSEISQKEQRGVGLNQLTKEQLDEFVLLNQKYVKKFGFPFIMAVKGQNKDSILAAMKERVDYSYEAECRTALNEVYKIARFRINDIID
jgi:2-oxo-4-hydroxy-4-carboxy-5-ureidoimidazoline decarboxylase